ncbi:SpoIIE family protein phosphatase [Streptomyces tanashiensis]|uniref:SpoIIE family protein phosphatase n=1 Tax=Streptomyces tanashiensis TaxID=67367 RepID=UPI0036E6D374
MRIKDTDPTDLAQPFDAVGVAAAVLDPAGVVIGWSRAAEQLLGYTAKDVLNRPAATLLADDAPSMTRVAEDCVARGGWSGRLPLRHRDGRRAEQAVQVSPLLDAAGRTCWLVSIWDEGWVSVPEMHQLMFEPFVNRSPVGVAVLGRDLRYVWVNDVFTYQGALPREQRIGRRISEAMPDLEVGPYLEAQFRRVLGSGKSVLDYEMQARMPTPESPLHAYRVSIFPLQDRAGRIHGVWYMGTDVSEQWQARERLLLLNDAGARIGTTLDVGETARQLADVVVPRFADFAAVDLVDTLPEVREPYGRTDHAPDMYRAAMRSVSEEGPETHIRIGEAVRHPPGSPAARALAEGRVILESFAGSWASAEPPTSGTIKPHSALAVPLRARDATLGVMQFARWRCPDPFEQDDALLVEELAARAGVCVDNARRFTRERTAARVLQRSLMPRVLFARPAVEVASRYVVPAGIGQGLGSDWFDVIPLSGARVALVVGDVVGHGYHAAVTMGRLRTAVRAVASLDVPADEVLARLDDIVLTMQEAEDAVGSNATQTVAAAATGVRCLYVVYDPVAQRCTMARAGHLPPAVVRPDGTVSFPDLAAGPPLGLGSLPFESAEFELPDGSLLALFTDGLIRAPERGIDETLTRLAATLAQPYTDPEVICGNVARALIPDQPSDDVALLVARTHALGVDRVAAWDVPDDPSAVAGARERVGDQLAAWGLDELLFTTELAVSELVTNAIRYGKAPIHLRLIRDDTLICEVSDASSTSPRMRHARTTDEGGRGLFLVAQTTRRWGTRYTGAGKIIWAEQDLPSAAATRA